MKSVAERNDGSLHSTGGPAVTIGMTIRNEEKLIGRALDSLLAQTFTDFELIVSDSASTDRTGEICRAFAKKDKRIKYYRHETNISPNADCGRLVREARGKYFMFACGDDWWAPDFIKALVNELAVHPDAGLAMCAMHRTTTEGKHLDSVRFLDDAKNNPNNMTYLEMLIESATPASKNKVPFVYLLLGIYRTEILKKVMSIPLPELPSSDRLLLCHVALAISIRYVDEFLFVKTIHPDPLAVRHAHSESMRRHNNDKLAYTRVWLAFEQYLWASEAIPKYRKHLISVASDIFMHDHWNLLYRNDVSSPVRLNCNADVSDELHVVEYLKKRGSFIEAHKLASVLALERPDSADLMVTLAELKAIVVNKRAAQEVLLDVVKDCPDNTRALSDLAVILWERGKHNDAMVFARDAVSADKNNIDTNMNLAKMLAASGNLEESQGYLDHILQLAPQNTDVLKLLSSIKIKAGDLKEARELLERAKIEAPGDKEIDGLLQKTKQGK